MIIVELPVKTIQTEIDKLTSLDPSMEFQSLYAKGAIDALKWVLGTDYSPSKNPDFPIYSKESH